MPDAKLTALTEATAVEDTDLVYGVVGGNSRKVSVATLLAAHRGLDLVAVAGEALAEGAVVRLNSEGKVYLAWAEKDNTRPALGITRAAADADAYVTVRVEGEVIFQTDPNWTPGSLLYLSDLVAGEIAAGTAPSEVGALVQLLGIAVASDTLLLRVDLNPTTVPA